MRPGATVRKTEHSEAHSFTPLANRIQWSGVTRLQALRRILELHAVQKDAQDETNSFKRGGR